MLSKEFVPLLIKEIEQNTEESEWLLNNFSAIVKFLIERNLFEESHVPTMFKFFEVIQR